MALAKRELAEAATAWAHGGIVGVLGNHHCIDSQVRDIQCAGAGLIDALRLESLRLALDQNNSP